MREILFRGKLSRNNKWAYGSPVTVSDIDEELLYAIVPYSKEGHKLEYTEQIIPETICQFTGLYDKNNVRIFEGDIIKAEDDYDVGFTWDGIGVVNFSCGMFSVPQSRRSLFDIYECNDIEVIGNIYDNKELFPK